MNLNDLDIPKIKDDHTFEYLIKSLFESDITLQNININGRPGQKQDGVDVFAKKVNNGDWIGVQCKVMSTIKTFQKKSMLAEVEKAKRFNPKLSEYYIYTTLSRDQKTQEFAREIGVELNKNTLFTFQVLFWEDIIEVLTKEQNESVFYRYFHKLFKDNLSLGHLIGKLVNLEVGLDKAKPDTHYELILGKIPKHNEDGHYVDYYRGTYYIINLHERSIEFFLKEQNSNRAHCFPSDIEVAFKNSLDRYRVCEWISSIENMDDFIYDDEHNYEFSLSSKKYDKFIKDKE